MPERPGLLAPLTRQEPVVDDTSVELTVENGPAVGAEVLRALDAAQIPVAGLALREPSLDDVFLSLTGHKTEAETDEERAARRRRSGRRAGATRRRRPTERTPHDAPSPSPHRTARRRRQAGSRLGWAVQDTLTVTWRNLLALIAHPRAVFFSAVQPIMFVLLFVYVFGGAIHIPGSPTSTT